MDAMYTQPLVDMGVSLAELAVKGTASAVSKKVRAAKEIKEIEKLRTTYEGDPRCAYVRYLDPANPKSGRKVFYSDVILSRLDGHYTKR